MAHPNEEVLKKGYAAFNSGDMDAVRETFADDIVWHVSGTTELAGDYKGLDEASILRQADRDVRLSTAD
jgi:ketosteroid isomerase-like protein